jgi:hypothetical protein
MKELLVESLLVAPIDDMPEVEDAATMDTLPADFPAMCPGARAG